MTSSFCKIRPQEAPLEIEGRLFGVIEREAISPHSSDAAISRALYLDRSQGELCVYPVRIEPSESLDFESLYPAEFQKGIRHFGLPTRLESHGKFSLESGALYDSARGLFYARETQGKNWYLVGDLEAYRNFSSGIKLYVDQLEGLWNQDPWRVFFKSAWNLEPGPSRAKLELDEVIRAFGRFMPWLEKNEPELFEEMRSRLDFQLTPFSPSLVEQVLCRNRYADSAYASYDPQSKKIFLLPPALQWMIEGHYETVAQILSHESAHRSVVESGRVMPSTELLARSLIDFLNRLALRGLEERILIKLFGNSLFMAAQCNLLPIVPEEEIQAHAKEVAYGFSRDHGMIDADLIEEAVDLTDLMWTKMAELFPPEWSRLSSAYFFSAIGNEPSWLQDFPAATEIIRQFRDDALSRQACIPSKDPVCRQDSEELKKLRDRIAEHRQDIFKRGSPEANTRSKPWPK